VTVWLAADDLSEAASEGYDPFSVIVCSWNPRKWSVLSGTASNGRTSDEIGAVRAAAQEHRKRAFGEPLSTTMPQLGFTVQTWFFVLLDALDKIAHGAAPSTYLAKLDPCWASRIRNRYTSGDFFNAESIEEVRAMMSIWLLDEGPLDRKSIAVAAWIEQSQAFKNIAWGIRYNQPSTWPTPPGEWSRK